MNGTLPTRKIALLSVAALSVASQASIVGFDSTKAVKVTSLSDMKYHTSLTGDADGLARIWDEGQNVTLGSALKVDAAGNGTYDSLADLTNTTLAAGTKVDSQYINFNPKTIGALSTSFTFSGKIVGVIATSDLLSGDRLLASDGLALSGVPSANLPTHHEIFRGIEMRLIDAGPKLDQFTINGNSLTVNLGAVAPGDQIRVLTQPVPEPASFAAVGFGALGLLRRRRK